MAMELLLVNDEFIDLGQVRRECKSRKSPDQKLSDVQGEAARALGFKDWPDLMTNVWTLSDEGDLTGKITGFSIDLNIRRLFDCTPEMMREKMIGTVFHASRICVDTSGNKRLRHVLLIDRGLETEVDEEILWINEGEDFGLAKELWKLDRDKLKIMSAAARWAATMDEEDAYDYLRCDFTSGRNLLELEIPKSERVLTITTSPDLYEGDRIAQRTLRFGEVAIYEFAFAKTVEKIKRKKQVVYHGYYTGSDGAYYLGWMSEEGFNEFAWDAQFRNRDVKVAEDSEDDERGYRATILHAPDPRTMRYLLNEFNELAMLHGQLAD